MAVIPNTITWRPTRSDVAGHLTTATAAFDTAQLHGPQALSRLDLATAHLHADDPDDLDHAAELELQALALTTEHRFESVHQRPTSSSPPRTPCATTHGYRTSQSWSPNAHTPARHHRRASDRRHSRRELTSLRQRWTTYQDLPTLTEHWYWRLGWHAGRHSYTWHLTFQDQPVLHHLVTDLQQQLTLRPGLDLVPLDGLHLTIQGIGFTDEIPDSDIEAIVAETRQRCAALPLLKLSLGPLDPDAEGIGLLVQPWDPVERIRTTIRATIAAVWWHTVPNQPTGLEPLSF
ncbi:MULTISPECIES: hypothetical protein [unclassified Micromonospora]|uniref:hypothetical protein n=1 Tax=unclassified Micromonospora TaxID=2617518 RepID=UPI00362BC012